MDDAHAARALDDGVMAYLKPPTIETRFFNPLALLTTLWDVHTLEVSRRRTGLLQRVPVIPVRHDGALYIVAARGESDWVRNVRAAGVVDLRQRGILVTYAATEVPAGQRSATLTAYRKKAGRYVNGYWKKLPGDADHPTFKLTPVESIRQDVGGNERTG